MGGELKFSAPPGQRPIATPERGKFQAPLVGSRPRDRCISVIPAPEPESSVGASVL